MKTVEPPDPDGSSDRPATNDPDRLYGPDIGPAAVTVNPLDVSAIAEGLRRVHEDTALRADLRARGLAHAATFTWERCARQTLAAYRQALAD